MNKTLSTIILCLAIFAGMSLMGQSRTSSIVVTSFVPEQDNLSATSANKMENKVSQMITNAGMASVDNSRFVVIPRFVVNDVRTQASAPPMIVMNADVTFYMGDVSTGKVFGSFTKTLTGVGENETRACVSVISNIKPKDAELQRFMENGKQKIIDYYNENADILIRKAQQLAATADYRGALVILGEIPEECIEAFEKASGPMISIYQAMIDYEGNILYQQAYTLWNATQDYDGAMQACSLLAQISPNSSAAPRAYKLADNIGKRVREVDNREWNFVIRKEQNRVELQKAIIQAITQIARAEANRPIYNYNNLGWW